MSSRAQENSDEYNEKDAQKRFDAALKGALKTPHKPLKEKRETGEPASRPRSRKKKDK